MFSSSFPKQAFKLLTFFCVIISTSTIISCARQSPGQGTAETIYMEHDGYDRAYRLYTPSSYDPSQETSLVVLLHGFALDSQQTAGNPDMEVLADSENFIIAYPHAVGGIDLDPNTTGGTIYVAGGFNAGTECCEPGSTDNIDDVGFVRMVVDDVIDRKNIDEKRIYATGVSAGSAMSFRLAVEAGDVFAAILGISGPYMNGIENVSVPEPVTTIAFDGLQDTLIPYEGGTGWASAQGIGEAPSREENFETFAEESQCVGSPVETYSNAAKEITCMTYQNCQGHSEVTQCIFARNNHFISTPLDTVTKELSNELTWEFLSEHAKP